MRFEVRFLAYILLLTDRYPNFSTETAPPAPQPVNVA
jgi:hypothetical protein